MAAIRHCLTPGVIALSLITACGAGDVPETGESLGGELRSGMSLEVAKRLPELQGCLWVVTDEEKTSTSSGQSRDSAVAPGLTTAISDSCKHLGVSGDMKLEFVDNHLMAVEFVPDDGNAYMEALGREIRESVEEGKMYHPGGSVVVTLMQRNSKSVAIWQNSRLTAYYLSGA